MTKSYVTTNWSQLPGLCGLWNQITNHCYLTEDSANELWPESLVTAHYLRMASVPVVLFMIHTWRGTDRSILKTENWRADHHGLA